MNASVRDLASDLLPQFTRSRDFAVDCDAADILAPYRKQFALPRGSAGQTLVYLCGHSLGLAPLAALDYVSEELAEWAQLGVAGHHTATRPWIDYAANFTKGLTHLTGALPGEVVVMNSLTVNLHLMMASFYRPVGMRDKVLIEAGAFSSDRHAVLGQLAWHQLDPADALVEIAPRTGEETLRIEDVEARIAELGNELALVLWPGVQFRTGQNFDVARIARAAHRVGALAGFDLAHAIGNVPLALHEAEADFAVWCSYKYLNAGPGAIGGCFVHEKHFATAPSRLSGWWGHEPQTRFQMLPEFRPAAGAAGWAVSNPPIFSAAPLLASLEIFRSAGMDEVRAKSMRLTAYAERLLVERAGTQVEVLTPRDPVERGCQLSLRIAGGSRRGRRIFDALGDHGVVCDWREPDVIRIAPVPLYNRFEDVFEFVEQLVVALKEIA
ncbi:MAG TPA: kynureninase [Steroidobacteraceae bacterium]|nr:kynureninase [Steroidobacteraceae bacterium]